MGRSLPTNGTKEDSVPSHSTHSPQPGPGEYAATAENLYHDLIARRPSPGSTDGHVLIRLAQAVNRAWAELTLANGTSQAFHAGDIDG